jgi:DNA-binding SARP family transcriptional activator/Tfp pilus assembly protein PilF
MRLGILGPLLITDDDGQITVAAPRQRALLAALLVRANRTVPVQELTELIWDTAPPGGAPRTVRSYVVRLRRVVGPAVATRIVTMDPGYRFEVAEDELDVLRFEALCRQGGAAVRTRAWQRARLLLEEALGLWRGTPLEDVASQALRLECAEHLEQARLQATEWRLDADLHLGRHQELIPELQALADEHPLRERGHAMLMLALYRCGRVAEALEAFQRARRLLVAELGIEPGPELRAIQEKILAGDAGLAAPSSRDHEPAVAASHAPDVVPRQLPAAVGHFTGRAAELRILSDLAARTEHAGGTVVLSAIGGMGGVGKTALAMHWAHQHAARFPDGQLYIDLHGFSPAGAPVTAPAAARRFLDALAVPAADIPASPDALLDLYRTVVAGRRMLIVLDNASDSDQVEPLLPGTAGCMVLVTSRSTLTHLVALNGAVPLSVDVLSRHEARELLARRLGTSRVTSEQTQADELIDLCARLPLALNIAAARTAARPRLRIAELTAGLRDIRRRLDLLSAGPGAADVRAVFSWSYRTLDQQTARVFRLLGLHPGPDIGVEATASLTALDPGQARRALDTLTRAYLITEHAAGRYTLHDLLRVYAAEQAQDCESQTSQHDALRRLCDFYVHTACGGDRILGPHRRHPRLGPPAPGTHPHPLPDDPAAMTWFDAEHPSLLALQHAAAAHGWDLTVWQLAWALFSFHARRARLHDDLAVWQAAAAAAARLPDPAARITACRFLGAAHGDLGHHQDAVTHLHQALSLAEHHHDLLQQADTHYLLGRAWEQNGNEQRALHHATHALRLFRDLGQPGSEADALNVVGWYTARLGDYDTARIHCRAALALYRGHPNPLAEAATLDSLGYIEHRAGHHLPAISYYQQALTRYQDLDHAYQTANTLDHLGHPYAALGEHHRARTVWQQALDLYQRQGRVHDAACAQKQLDALGRALGAARLPSVSRRRFHPSDSGQAVRSCVCP